MPTPSTAKTQSSEGLSYDTKTIIVVLTLILVYPVGLILMIVWMKWPWWVKLLVAIPVSFVFFVIFGIFAVAFLAAVNPQKAIQRAECVRTCMQTQSNEVCVRQCAEDTQISPTLLPIR